VSDRQPQPKDRVRISYEGEVTDLDDHEVVAMVRADGENRAHYVPGSAMVEMIETADDHRPDLWGTIRTEPPDGLLWVKCRNGDWTCLSLLVDDERDGYVTGFPITGAVPNTPAAGANPVPPEVKLREDQIREGLELSPLIDAGPGNRPVVARVFQSDGPEPPESVMCLRYLDGDPDTTRTPFLRRTEVGWIWATETSTIVTRHGSDWPDAVRACPGRYVEVVQP